MAGTAQVGLAPSTLAKVQQDLTTARQRQDQVASDIEAMADALSGPTMNAAANGDASLAPAPAGSVNAIDALVQGLATPADRIEIALARIRGAIG